MSIRLQHPLPGAALTARFGLRSAFTENGVYIPVMLHDGADLAANEGTRILAAHGGRVTFVGWLNNSAGWTVRIGSAFGSTMYCHMREPSPLVSPGDEVRVGQPIGHVGQSGMATGAHLHFMLELGSGWIDPLPYLNSTPKPQPKPAEETPMNRGMFYMTNGVYNVLIGQPSSGWGYKYTTRDANFNDKMVKLFQTPGLEEVDQSIYNAFDRSLADVRQGK